MTSARLRRRMRTLGYCSKPPRVVGVDHDADELADPAQFFNATGNPPAASANRHFFLEGVRCKLGFRCRRTYDAPLPHRARDCAELSVLFRRDPSSGTTGGKRAALDYPAPNPGWEI